MKTVSITKGLEISVANTTKELMNYLMSCVKDKNISIQERNDYYAEYLKLAQNYLSISK